MNKALYFIAGAVVGGIVGSIAAKKALEARTDAQIEAEIQKYKEDTKRRNGASERVTEVSQAGKKRDGEEISPKTISSTSLDGGKVDIERTDYHKISESYVKPSPENLFNGNDPAENEHPEDDSPDFEIISGNEIDTLDPEQITYLLWDVESNALKDEFGDEIEDRELLVGDILDDILSENPNGLVSSEIEHTIYIANHKIGVYYEVDVVTEAGGAEPVND